MNRTRLRLVAAIALIAGGALVVVWAVVGVLPMDGVTQLGEALLVGSYACTGGGIGCLSWLAYRTDDAIRAGVIPVALGLVLVAPALLGWTGVVTAFPVPLIFLGITVVGLMAVLFGAAVLLTVILFTDDSTLVAHPWGRGVVVLAAAGIAGWVLSFAFAEPVAPPQAFMLVTPYSPQVAAPGMWVSLMAFSAGGLSLCLFGWALIQHPSRPPATEHPV